MDYTLCGNFPVFKMRSLSLYDNNPARFAHPHIIKTFASMVGEAVGAAALCALAAGLSFL
ncbi:hypothetical protein [Paenibacillus alkaliterrae]|uniref:hypothetical protein n=1 Tax=Paenibacillus alkaliterrae TaxID=320909 RepID=UPI0039EF32B0